MVRREYQILEQNEFDNVIRQSNLRFIYFIDEQIGERVMQRKGAILSVLLAGKRIKLDDVMCELEEET